MSYMDIVHTHEISISFSDCEVSSLALLLEERFSQIKIEKFFASSSRSRGYDITTLLDVIQLLELGDLQCEEYTEQNLMLV